MDDPLAFTPAPTRRTTSGWIPERQRRFVEGIWLGLTHDEAAARVGMTRQSAYQLRRRPGGEGFAAAWAAAAEGASRLQALDRSGMVGLSGLDGLLQPQFYRGRLVGFTIREDDRAILARFARHGWRGSCQG